MKEILEAYSVLGNRKLCISDLLMMMKYIYIYICVCVCVALKRAMYDYSRKQQCSG